MNKTISAIALVFALAAFAAGCGSSSNDKSSDTNTGGTASQASTTGAPAGGAAKGGAPAGGAAAASSGSAVDIKDFAFAPATLMVSSGDSVSFTNNDSAPHTATADNGSFDTGTLNQGDSKDVSFDAPGTIAYTCSIHPFMHGTIVVQ